MLANDVNSAWANLKHDPEDPLQSVPLSAAPMLMPIFFWMWSSELSASIGSYLAFSITIIAHVTLLSAGIASLIEFRTVPERLSVQRSYP